LLLPETERLARRVVVLPTGTAIVEADVSAICGVIRLVAAHGRELRKAMASREQTTAVAQG
jgi:hypothetical protein